jgi:hypothetical protein
MARTKPTSPLLYVVLVLVVLGAGIAVLVGDDGRRDTDGGRGERLASVPDATAPVPQTELVTELVAPTQVRVGIDEWAGDCTVLWPLHVELTRETAAYLPTAEGVPAVGSGANARLRGLILDSRERGVRAEVRFVAGPNEGTTLVCDKNGAFGSDRLYPGLNVVEVDGPGILGSRREVRLRQNRVEQLNLAYGRPASVHGRVIDPSGEGIESARVNFDGQTFFTGHDGTFFVPRVSGGPCLVEIAATGRASHREVVNVTSGKEIPVGRLQFTLHPSTSFKITVSGAKGGSGPVQVFVLPGSAERVFPWHTINPIEVWPGRPHVVEGLPAKVVKVTAFHGGASAPLQIVNLRKGRQSQVKIQLRPAPKVTGHVTLDGEPVFGARVRLEAPDRVRATLGWFREPNHFLESDVLPMLPPATQETLTDERGRYVLTAWDDVASVRYLEARGPHGRTLTGRLVQKGEEVVDLELEETSLFTSELVLHLPDRMQGLPVEVVRDGTPIEFMIDGQPRSPLVIGPHEPLVIPGLLAGTWTVKATWYAQPVFEESGIEVLERTERTLTLPREAIVGQDEETWRRAGRDWPL